jgi:hypothetical protein
MGEPDIANTTTMRTVKAHQEEERNVPEFQRLRKPVEANLLIAFDSFFNSLCHDNSN